MKRVMYVVVPCVLALVFYLSVSSLSSFELGMTDHLSGRRLLEEQHWVPASKSAGAQKLVNMETKGGFGGEEHVGAEDDPEELILNADYQGVTTHPSPLPKHPKP